MTDSSFNYVKTCRQRHALDSTELAQLIGLKSHTQVSAYEKCEATPTLERALALQIVFGLQPRELFPGLFEMVEDAVVARSHDLYRTLENLTDARSRAKRELLEEIPRRTHSNDIEL